MIIDNIKNFYNGWFVGSFKPTIHNTENFEVGFKKHKKGEFVEPHYHKIATEINLLVRGKMIIQDTELNSGDIFILKPYEIANPIFLEDSEILVIKTSTGINDKFII
jgi:hypothetical protein